MKRYSFIFTLSLAMLICALPALGQITITSSDFPTAVGTLYSMTCSGDVVSVNPGPAGANQTWDLRGTTANISAEVEIVDRASTPNPSWIPDANVITKTSDDIETASYQYTQLTSSFAKMLGVAFVMPESSYVVEWENEPPSFVFPIQYGNNWMSRIYWELNIGGGIVMEYSDSAWFTVDGWGTVLVDGMEAMQCLRIKEHTHLVAAVMGIPVIDEWSWRYAWIAPGYPNLASMDSEPDADENFITGHFCRSGSGSAAEEPIQILPLAFELQTPFPNPFNPETTIPYTVNQPTDIELSVFNTLGQKVRTLVNGQVVPGEHSIIWNGTDNTGNQVSAGVYYCRMISPEGTSASQKLTLVK